MNKIWPEHCFDRFCEIQPFLPSLFHTSVSAMFFRQCSASLGFICAELCSCSSAVCLLRVSCSLTSQLSCSLSPSSGSVLRRRTLARAAAGSLGEFLKLRVCMTPAGGDVISSSSSSSRCVLGFLSCSMDWDRIYRTNTREKERKVSCFIVSLAK